VGVGPFAESHALFNPAQEYLRNASLGSMTEEELVETITHLAFYAGWPNAVSSIAVAKEVFKK
jgi:4-carboxymuconolactone decarboxylase